MNDPVMDIPSEQRCEDRIGECPRTSRPEVFNSLEAVVHIINSMFNQHADRRELDLLAPERAEFIRGFTWAESR